jgi:glyoxylase-like metal-dependent hydrolase (beta-lactamase superfamily II)
LTSATALADPALTAINDIANAMGGVERLQSAHNQVITASIVGFAPLQAATPGGEPERFANVTLTMTQALDGERYHNQWTMDPGFPLISHYDFTEIIDGEHGAVIGADSILQLPQAPMQAIRLAARQVNSFVTSPVAIVKSMLASPQDVVLHGSRGAPNKGVTILSMKKYGKDIVLWVDNRRHLPVQVSYWDANPAYGDTHVTTRYSNWQAFDGIKVPMTVEQSDKRGRLMQIDRHSVTFDVTFAQDPFQVPAELVVPLDERAYAIGLKYSQWFSRYLMTGFPFDLNQFASEAVSLQPVGDGVYYLRGYTHHSLVVEMADYLVLFDPVLLEERTQAVLPAIRQQWPDKKIKYVVPTHFHVDHSSGLRGYLADGARLITTKSNQDFFKQVLKSPHVIYPDLLSLTKAQPRITVIDDGETFTLDDGHRRVHLMQVENRHAPGLIVPYIEDQKMLFVSDLYNPGFFPAPIPPQFSYWGLDLYKDLQARAFEFDVMVGAHGDVGSYKDFLNAIAVTFPGL